MSESSSSTPCRVCAKPKSDPVHQDNTSNGPVCEFLPSSTPCAKNMGNDLLVIPCDLPKGHVGPCERKFTQGIGSEVEQ